MNSVFIIHFRKHLFNSILKIKTKKQIDVTHKTRESHFSSKIFSYLEMSQKHNIHRKKNSEPTSENQPPGPTCLIRNTVYE